LRISHLRSMQLLMEKLSMFEEYLKSFKDHTKDGKDGKEGKDDGCHLDDIDYSDQVLL
jgi:hypothetical protein